MNAALGWKGPGVGKMIERLFGAATAVSADRRKTARTAASGRVTIKSVSGETIRAELSDVSMHGCSAQTDAAWLRNGRIVTLILPPDESLQAIIRWSDDGITGFEFLRPVTAEKRQWSELIDSPWTS